MREQLGMTGRPGVLPPGAACYRRIGPFDRQNLPSGLLHEHQLKEGVWGVVTLVSGSMHFIWDDVDGGELVISAPDSLVIPPETPHHVAANGDFSLEIEFYR